MWQNLQHCLLVNCMDVRPAVIGDLDSLHSLQYQLNLYRDSSYTVETVQFHARVDAHTLYTKEDIERGGMFVAYADDVMVGYIAGSIFERPHHAQKKGLCVDELFVREEYRKQGISRALINILEVYAKEAGCTYMTVTTDYENTLSRSFYQSSGMIEATVEYWKPL